MGYCRDCKKRWISLSECHCSGCHEHFKGDFAFTKHRIGKPDFKFCMTVEEMKAKGMFFDSKKQRWISGQRPVVRYASE